MIPARSYSQAFGFPLVRTDRRIVHLVFQRRHTSKLKGPKSVRERASARVKVRLVVDPPC